MPISRSVFFTATTGLALIVCCPAQAATVVSAASSVPMLLGVFGPGTYQYTVTGVVSLAGPVGSGFDLDPNGVPITSVTVPGYSYFNPNGADNDKGTVGRAGPGINLGALVGSYNSVDFFLLGGTGTFAITAPGTALFGLVNDTSNTNNGGSFSFEATAVQAGVPEPATWAMMIAGFGLVGGAMRRRSAFTQATA